MGTIRGLKLPVPEQIDVAAKAGYQGVELWLDELRKYTDQGGSLDDLRKRIADLGLTVESSIGFTPWMVDDDAQRTAGLEQWKRELEMLARVGCKRAAAPPSGASKKPITDLLKIAERYRVLLEMGRQAGVVPQLEFWGPSKTLSRLSEAMFVAVEAGHPDACLLLDAYQIYRGGSSFESLRLLNGHAVHVCHINDYPADPPREKVTDAHRLYPGDGVAPLVDMLRTMRAAGFQGFLSLEIFNRDYWKHDALTVARTGLEKTRAVAEKAL
jgi:sugar phosphate isomerase/epimerase